MRWSLIGSKPVAELLRTRLGMATVVAVVVLTSLVVYLPTLRFEAVWEDPRQGTANTVIAGPDPLRAFSQGYWPPETGPLTPVEASVYRPVTTLSIWLQYRLFGCSPAGGHLVNVLLHTATAGLVTLIIWELLHSGVWALLGGLLFTLHPAQAEPVAHAAARSDLLAGMFITFASLALLRGQRKHNHWWWLLVPPAGVLALLSKENALLFPVLCALMPLLTRTRYSPRYWLMTAAVIAFTALGLFLRTRAVPWPTLHGLPPGQTAANAANTFGLYLRSFFVPLQRRVLFPPDPAYRELTDAIIGTILFIVTVPLAALRRRFWITLWGYGWVLAFLLPVLNWLPLANQISDRLLYLPSVGLVLIIITTLSRLLSSRPRLRSVVGVTILAVTAFLGIVTVNRLGIWRNRQNLAAAMIAEAPGSPIGYTMLAETIADADPDSAIALYNRAIIINQEWLPAHTRIAELFVRKNDWRRASHHLRIANEIQPGSPLILTSLGQVFLASGRPDSAAAYARLALERSPDYQPAVELLRSAAGWSRTTPSQ